MASWDDVRRIALGLPETIEVTSHGHASWRVRDKGFAADYVDQHLPPDES
jgi:hypothetical protein